ncbi:hypothetical protein NL108_014161, partial [Boleophthalmus pectinirostris]
METIYPAQHLSVQQLKSDPQNGYSNYLHIKVPSYPRPELHVAHLSHCTDQTGIFGILNDSGFRSPGYRGKRVVWFSLTVSRAELKEAEDRPMTIVHSDGTEEHGVLKTFATSPAFSSSSRLGSFCFTFPLQDVLDKYSQQ